MSVLASRSQTSQTTVRARGASGIGLLSLALLVGLAVAVMAAGAASATPSTQSFSKNSVLSTDVRLITFQVTNNVTATEDVQGITFTVPTTPAPPDDWRLVNPQTVPAGWTILGTPTTTSITFNGTITPGNSANFTLNAKAGLKATRGPDTWTVTTDSGKDCLLAPCFEAISVGVQVETLGVSRLVVVAPQSSAEDDGEVSSGQTATLRAYMVNTRGGEVTGTIRVTATGETASQSASTPFQGHPNNGTITLVQWEHTFSNVTAVVKRSFTATPTVTGEIALSLNNSEIFVVRPPLLNGTDARLIPVAAGSPDSITGRRDLIHADDDPSQSKSATGYFRNTTTNLTVTLKNTGDANATDVTLGFRFYEAGLNPVDATRFVVSHPTIPRIAKNQVVTVPVSVAPVACNGSDCSGSATEGRYNVSFDISLKDANTAASLTTQNVTNSSKTFTVDHSLPVMTVTPSAGISGTLQFQRGGANVITRTVNVSDASLSVAAANVSMVILDSKLKADCTAAADETISPNEPAGFRCRREAIPLTKSGTDWTISRDFATTPLGAASPIGTWDLYIYASDRAGNFNTYSLGRLRVDDTAAPVVTNFNGPTTGTRGSPLVYSAVVKDEFKVGKVLLSLVHESGDDIAKSTSPNAVVGATADGVELNCVGNCPADSRNGTYQREVVPTLSGAYTVKLRVIDASPRANAVTIPETINLVVVTALSFYLDLPSGQAKGLNLSVTDKVSQSNQAVFDKLTISNDGGGAEEYNFECKVVQATTNVSGVQACNVSYLFEGEPSPSPFPARPRQGQSWPNTVNVTIYKNVSNTKTFISNHTGTGVVGSGATMGLVAQVSVPPAARPGQVVRIELIAKPRFGAERAAIVLGYEVVETRGISLLFDDGSERVPSVPDAPNEITRVIKPTRTSSYSFRLNNTGNVELRYDVKLASNPALPSGWVLDFSSSDPDWNDAQNSVVIPPTGAANNANSTVVQVTITPPSTQLPGLVPLQIAANTSKLDGTALAAANANLNLQVVQPTVSILNWGANTATFRTVQAGNNTTVFPTPNAPDPCGPPAGTGISCSFIPGHTPGGWYNLGFRVRLESTLNTPDDRRIQGYMLLTNPCRESCADSESRLSLTPSGGQLAGADGTYDANLNLTDPVGIFRLRVFATDFNGINGDTFESLNVTMTFADPQVTAPTVCCVVVREGSETATPLVKDAFNRYKASFGVPIFVSATMDDSFGLGGNLSSMTLQVEQRSGGTSQILDRVPMKRGASIGLSGAASRIVNATYTGSFTPAGSAGGVSVEYIFRLQGRDANDNSFGLVAENPLFLDLLDLRGPTIVPGLVSPGVSGAPLDVEVGVGPVNITARVTDNSDALGVPGGAINRTADKQPFALLKLGTLTKNYTLTQVPGSLQDWTFTIPAADINATGAYTVEVFAWDLANNLGKNTTTLQVLVNLPPQIAVTSPPLTDGFRFASTTTPVTVTIQDANVDANATGAIVVEVQQGGGNFTAVTPTISGAKPLLTMTIPVSGEGNSTIRVTATDTLGLSNTTTFSVRVDVTPPSSAIVNIDAADINVKAARASASDPFTVAPSARLFVSATDAGSGLGGANLVIKPSGGQARNHTLARADARFTLAEVFGTSLLDGDYTIGGRVSDRVGNSATVPDTTVKVDSGAPVIGPITPSTPLSVRVTDARSLVKTVTVEWAPTQSLDGRQSFSLSASGETWSADFPAEATGNVFFVVKATDAVGNVAEGRCNNAACQLAFGNRPPVLTLTVTSGGSAVQSGGVVRGNATIAWTATDPEGVAVPVTVRVRDSLGAEKALVTDAPAATTQVSWDTAAERDGTWVISVTGSDGRATGAANLTVVIRNVRVQVETPLPSNVNAGGSLLLNFDVTHPTKRVRSVSAILRVGSERETVPLVDDGSKGDRRANDGVWSSTYTPRLRGTYSVDLQVTYEDNQQSTLSNVATFQAEGGGGGILTPPAFIAVLVLGVIVVALGVFGIRRWP